MRQPGSGTRRVAEEHFAAQGFAPNAAMSLGGNKAIKHAVLAGLGVAVLSELAVQPPSPVGVWRRDQSLTVAARRFVAYLQGRPGVS
jgi:DNA-binding transcriptional LysR family regulator